MARQRLLKCLLAFPLLFIPVTIYAQVATQADLSALIVDSFPRISAILDVRDESGHFISELEPANIQIIENDQTIEPTDLTILEPGAQIVVAINPGTPFAIQDEEGVSRFEHISAVLTSWMTSSDVSQNDDLSLLTTDGPQEEHLDSPDDWLTVLQGYQPDTQNLSTNLDILSRALDVATDPAPRVGMGKAVLFITVHPGFEAVEVINNLAARAEEIGVRVFVWMIDSRSYFNSENALAFTTLTNQTGGAFFLYSGSEEIPNPNSYFSDLRNVFRITYESQIRQSGSHQLYVEINGNGWRVATPSISFDLDVQPPNPIFIAPPSQITLTSTADEVGNSTEYTPKVQDLEIIIEFPDGYERDLIRSRLFVDGELADENINPPFDQFTWDLSSYQVDGLHTIRVEVLDVLDLSGNSIDIPVQISLEVPPSGFFVTLSRYASVLAIGIVVVAGTVFILVLIWGGRVRPQSIYIKDRPKRKRVDPLTQPVQSNEAAEIKPRRKGRFLEGFRARFLKVRERAENQPHAFLTRVLETGETVSTSPAPITESEITIGTNPARALIVLDDKSVDDLHARIVNLEKDIYYLYDNNTIAGTWLNYAPVSKEGVQIQHGDLIHVGNIGFRFTMREPKSLRKIQITQLDERL